MVLIFLYKIFNSRAMEGFVCGMMDRFRDAF